MASKSCAIRKKHAAQSIVVFALMSIFLINGCVTAPKLTPEDRKRDIQYLADWTRDYNPFVELNEKYKKMLSYEALLPHYLELAEQAETNEEFFKVVNSFFRLIGITGHFIVAGEGELKLLRYGSILGLVKYGVTPGQIDRGMYWAKLAQNIPYYAHPPFHIDSNDGKYFTYDEWNYEGINIPKGSEILKVNGLTCSQYLDYVKNDTVVKYDSWKDWVDQYLITIDEGPSFKGWQVDFGLPDGQKLAAFVPKVKGYPTSKEVKVQTIEQKENCTCLELNDEVGYIRVKSFFVGGALSYLFRDFIKDDRNKIKKFLNQSDGKYSKLIIDLRNNGGGMPQYGYDNLISPFLDEPVTYSQVVGLKTKYLADTEKSVMKFIRNEVSKKKGHAINITEINSPEEFDPNLWTFYDVTRKIKPRNRYNFKGEVYFLMNGGCYSAADDILNASKRIGMANLVGRNTGGGAAGYVAPPFIALPASGMVLRVETDLVINPDGSYDELTGTPPDIELPIADPPKSITKEDLLDDEWIKWIIADEQNNNVQIGN